MFIYIMVNSCLPSLVAQLVKNPPTMLETWVRSLGWEDPLEKGTATHFSILAWRIPWTVESKGLQRVGHYWVTFTQTIVKYEKKQVWSKDQNFIFMCRLYHCWIELTTCQSIDVSSTGFLTLLSTVFISPDR